MTQPRYAELALAHRLLTREAGEAGGIAETLAASDRVFRQLDVQLSRWFGRDGSRALFARAFDRAHAEHPLLAEVALGDAEEIVLTGVAERLDGQDPHIAREAMVMVIAIVVTLLTRIIGSDLVARLVRQAWPNEHFEEQSSD